MSNTPVPYCTCSGIVFSCSTPVNKAMPHFFSSCCDFDTYDTTVTITGQQVLLNKKHYSYNAFWD